MTRADFWRLIEKSGPRLRDDANEQTTALQQLLEALPTEEIISFERHAVEVMHESYRGDLWDIVYIVQGGCSNDGFDYFRYWLILQGKVTFDRILAHPEAIADFDPSTSDLGNQEFGGIARHAYQEKTGGKDMPYDGPTGSGQLKGQLLSDEGRRKRYPALWKRFADDEEQENNPVSVSAYFRQLFAERPQFLASRTNEEAMRCFVRDHPGEQVSESIKAILLNVKCYLRSARSGQ